MPSNTTSIQQQDRLIAGFAAIAIVIHVLEAGFPSPIPGVKPGLANVVTLIVLLRHSFTAAAWVAGLRVLVGSLLVGSFLSPGFWLSLSGATGSLIVLGLAYAFGRRWPSLAPGPVGLALLSSVAHMSCQFLTAWRVFIPHPGLLRLLPPLLTAALLFGLASGWLTQKILQRIDDIRQTAD